MRMFGFERDNGTLLSQPDHRGNTYTVSFELYPFHEGATYTCYKGMLCGQGSRNGDFCVVKALRSKIGSTADWLDYRIRSQEAQRLANEFNRHIGYRAIEFEIPVIAELETVSDFTRIYRWFYPHEKRLQCGEYIVFEDFFEEKFQSFDTSSHKNVYNVLESGHANPCSNTQDSANIINAEYVRQQACDGDLLLQAFVHFTWCASRQVKVVCGFQGVRCEISGGRWEYCLSNPILHSQTEQFGREDGGSSAILEIMGAHQCNTYCDAFRSVQQRNLPSVLFTGASRG